jgi:hypothetical protein
MIVTRKAFERSPGELQRILLTVVRGAGLPAAQLVP